MTPGPFCFYWCLDNFYRKIYHHYMTQLPIIVIMVGLSCSNVDDSCIEATYDTAVVSAISSMDNYDLPGPTDLIEEYKTKAKETLELP